MKFLKTKVGKAILALLVAIGALASTLLESADAFVTYIC